MLHLIQNLFTDNVTKHAGLEVCLPILWIFFPVVDMRNLKFSIFIISDSGKIPRLAVPRYENPTWVNSLHTNSNEYCDLKKCVFSVCWSNSTCESYRYFCIYLFKKTFKKAAGTALKYTQHKNQERKAAPEFIQPPHQWFPLQVSTY